MPLSLDLRLDDRKPDRVLVSVRVVPDGAGQTIDGVALQLCARDGEALGPRLLLPICGCLGSPIVTRVELKSSGDIPADSHIVATAWWGREQVEVRVPSEICTTLEAHLRGRRQLPLAETVEVERLLPGERAVLARHMPWVDEPIVHAGGIEPLESESTPAEICQELGLEGEDAQWLKDLLEEDDRSL